MSLIDRAATFRGNVVDHAVSTTKNGFPQFVCGLVANEIYDEEDHVWVDWSGADEKEITAYVVLYGKAGETLSFNQVKKVFNWDGASFVTLNNGDYSEVGIQFRVESDTYMDKPQLKVNWIDEYDATPGRSVKKLDADELKQLDAKYASQLKANKKVTPAKAGLVKAKGAKPTSPKGPVTKTTKPALPTDAPIQPAPATSPDKDAIIGHCTKNEAWDTVVSMRDKKITDAKLAQSWLAAVKEIGEDEPVETLTDEQFFLIKERVMKETAAF